jgi:hypothetical protein
MNNEELIISNWVRLGDPLGGKGKAEIKIDKAEVRFGKAEVGSEKAEVRSGKAEVGSGKAEVKFDKAEIRSEKAEMGLEGWGKGFVDPPSPPFKGGMFGDGI